MKRLLWKPQLLRRGYYRTRRICGSLIYATFEEGVQIRVTEIPNKPNVQKNVKKCTDWRFCHQLVFWTELPNVHGSLIESVRDITTQCCCCCLHSTPACFLGVGVALDGRCGDEVEYFFYWTTAIVMIFIGYKRFPKRSSPEFTGHQLISERSPFVFVLILLLQCHTRNKS